MNRHGGAVRRALRGLRMVAAGVSMCCPRCERGSLFFSAATLRMRRTCPVCGWVFEREEGYWTGAVAIDLVITELVVSAVALGLVLLTNTPPLLIIAIGLPVAILFPILLYPLAKSFWMRFDLLTHPPTD